MIGKGEGRRAILAAAIAAISAAVLAGCGGSSGGSGGASASAGSSDGTIDIGFISDLSGVYSTFGYPNLNGALLEAQLINKAGGVVIDGKHYKLAIHTCEANSDTAQAAACAQHLTRDLGYKIVMGGAGAEGPVAAAQTEAARALYFAPGSSLAAVIDKYPHAFVTLPSTTIKYQLGVEAVKKIWPDAKTVAFLSSDDPTKETLPIYYDAFKAAGYKVLGTQIFKSGTLDVTPQLSKLKALHPDVLWIGWSPADVAVVVKQNHSVQAAPHVYAWGGAGTCDVIKKAAGSQPIIANDQLGADLALPLTDSAKKFAAAYLDFVKNSPDAKKSPDNITSEGSALFYPDALALLAKVMADAKTSTDTDKLAQALTTTKISGIQGSYGFNDKHQVVIGVTHCTLNLPKSALPSPSAVEGERGSFYLPPPAGQ